MKLPTINESKLFRQAKCRLVSGDTFIDCIPKYYTEEQKQTHLDFWLLKERLTFLRQNLSRAGNRGDRTQIIEVDADYCYSIGEKQNWLCATTGDELEFKRGGTMFNGQWSNPKSCTIDRIDSSKGYIKGNIQLVTWEVNCVKRHFDNQEFIDLCKRVASFNK